MTKDNGSWQIKDISFTGNGCAISIASASILSEFVKDKSVRNLSKIESKDVFNLIGGPVAPARLKCALLGLEALRKFRIND
jgi:nitrogen fixation NifU-like protein